MATTAMHATAHLQIHPGKLEDFKRVVAQCMDVVRTKDPGTTEYDVFINADGTEAFVHERYRDSEAGLAHSKNIGELMAAMQAVATITGEVCGSPSPELRAMLEQAGVKIYAPFASLTA